MGTRLWFGKTHHESTVVLVCRPATHGYKLLQSARENAMRIFTSVNLKLAILAFAAGLTSAQAADPPNPTSGAAMPDHANRKVIIQEGKDNSKSVTQTGEDNDLELRQKGDRNAAELRQEGNANTLKVQQEAQDNHAVVNQQGNHNQVNIEQKGHGNRAVVRQNSQ